MIPLILALEILFDAVILPLIYGGAYRIIFHQSMVTNHYIFDLNIYKILSIFVILILNHYLFSQKLYLKPDFSEFGWQIFIFVCLLIIALGVTGKHFWLALDVGIIAALPEEIMFRGVIMGWLLEKLASFKQNYVNVYLALAIASIVFGCFHYINLAHQSFGFTSLQVLNAIGIGAILGAIYIKTGSLLIPIAFHFIYDFSATLSQGMPESNYVVISGPQVVLQIIWFVIQVWIAFSIVHYHFENNLLLQKIEKK